MSHTDDDHEIITCGQIDKIDLTRIAKPDLNSVPVLPTRNLVLFPEATIPVSLVRDTALQLARDASEHGYPLVVACQLDPSNEQPALKDVCPTAVLAQVIKVFDLPDGSHTALLHGIAPVRITGASRRKATVAGTFAAKVELLETDTSRSGDPAFVELLKKIKEETMNMLKQSGQGQEIYFNLQNMDPDVAMLNFVCMQMPVDVSVKMALLAETDIYERARTVLEQLLTQGRMLNVMEEIAEAAKNNFDDKRKRAFLEHQMEVIQEQLYGGGNTDVAELASKASALVMPEGVKRAFDKELAKLERLNPQSPDYAVQYGYLETLVDLPWGVYSDVTTDFKAATEILDSDHYGLKKVKERINEQLAVMMHNPDGNSPILCLVGPPGVGKTSVGASVAKALGRKYQRVSLGGLHDEAEIRGHRRTYIGAMPGRIIDALRRAGTSNPVLLLDEIDKIGADFKGDPSAALLEVLDPEQNCRFHDNYIDVDYDLSKVMFIATANTLSTVSQPLVDRMEVIDLSGYLLEEKVRIALDHLLPRLLKESNLKPNAVVLLEDTVAAIVERYTSESGVRQLEKALAKIVRKVIMEHVQAKAEHRTPRSRRIPVSQLDKYLGTPRYQRDRYEGNSFAGVVTGLAWTAVGGEILYIESSLAKGKGGQLALTGNLGNVMKESATIALQYVRSHASELGIDQAIFDNYQLHIHVPEGAIPKDGPSAGITMTTSIVSAMTQRKVRPRTAMTGETTLRGKVLPVGGIKEKILAAKRAGIDTIVLSSDNCKDIADIEPEYISGLTFHYVDTVDEVLEFALLPELVDHPQKFDTVPVSEEHRD